MPNERLNEPAHDRLSEAVRSFPAERARPDFTQAVLARLDAPAGRREPLFARRWILATATCGALLLGLGALSLRESPPSGELQAAEAREALARIRAEHARLQREVQSLASTAGTPASDEGMVYLGGNENVDFVVDLGRVSPAPRNVSTASYSTETY